MMARRKLAEPAADVLIGRKLHDAMAQTRAARQLANETGRRDDARDLTVVISTLAQCARRIDSREVRNRVVVQFRAPATSTEDE